MSAAVAVPRVVVVRATRHYRRARRPYLFGARPGDVRLDVLTGSHGRYLLTFDPDRAAEIGLLDGTERTPEDRAAQTMLMLADAVVCALGGEPIRFVCDGHRRSAGSRSSKVPLDRMQSEFAGRSPSPASRGCSTRVEAATPSDCRHHEGEPTVGGCDQCGGGSLHDRAGLFCLADAMGLVGARAGK